MRAKLPMPPKFASAAEERLRRKQTLTAGSAAGDRSGHPTVIEPWYMAPIPTCHENSTSV